MKLFLLRHHLKNVVFPIFAFLGIIIFNQKVFAEGTKEVSPNSTAITSLAYMPSINSGPFFNAGQDNRLYFRINDATTENLYFGANWMIYGSSTNVANMYYRIFDPSGTVVVGPTLWNASGNGFIADYTSAFNGPNIGGLNPSGYSPITFDPSTNGEYYIEFYRSNNSGVSQVTADGTEWAKAPYWDFTVATASNVKRSGRVHSDKWGLVAVDPVSFVPGGTVSAEPTFYAYTNDQTVVKIDFQSGFKPIAFNVAINSYGVSNTGNWGNDRKSRNDATAPTLSNGF
ncbi:MAG: hypothetical protein IPH28_19225 [Cytophagaceae bacterium]|nr:hypothetical protein [Cytophagaceae bacterium]